MLSLRCSFAESGAEAGAGAAERHQGRLRLLRQKGFWLFLRHAEAVLLSSPFVVVPLPLSESQSDTKHQARPKYLYLYLIYTAHRRGGSSGGTAWRGRLGGQVARQGGRSCGYYSRPVARSSGTTTALLQRPCYWELAPRRQVHMVWFVCDRVNSFSICFSCTWVISLVDLLCIQKRNKIIRKTQKVRKWGKSSCRTSFLAAGTLSIRELSYFI
jgi:hypothetical protein